MGKILKIPVSATELKRKPRVVPRRAQAEIQSPTHYRDSVDRLNYSFRKKRFWRYADRESRVINPIKADISNRPHLIVYDKKGIARFALRYQFTKGGITILSIQRERTQYRKMGNRNFWDAKMETQESKRLQQELGGMHPAEFLLSEFIYQHRKQIIKTGLRLRVPAYANIREYRPLISRFFEEKGRTVFGGTKFNFNLRKKRPKQILGI